MSNPSAAPEETAASRGPWLAFLGSATIWGSTFLVIAIGNDTLAPMWAAAIRLFLAAIVLSIITRLVGHEFPRGEALKAALCFGVFQFGLNFPLLYWGENHIPSGLSAVMYATVPLSSALMTRAFGIERLRPLKVVGALVALAGVALISGAGGSANRSHLVGALVVISSATLAAFGTTLLKRGPRQSAWGATAVGHAIGLPICVSLSLILREHWTLPPTAASWSAILYLTLLGSCGAFALFTWLVQVWPVTRAAFVSVIVPIIAMLLGAIVRHEPLTPRSLAGAALVLVGLACGMAADRLAMRGGAAAH